MRRIRSKPPSTARLVEYAIESDIAFASEVKSKFLEGSGSPLEVLVGLGWELLIYRVIHFCTFALMVRPLLFCVIESVTFCMRVVYLPVSKCSIIVTTQVVLTQIIFGWELNKITKQIW